MDHQSSELKRTDLWSIVDKKFEGFAEDLYVLTDFAERI